MPIGGTIVALNALTGVQLWTTTLSSAPVQSTPVAVGTTLCIGNTDGELYAQRTDGTLQWSFSTGSAITTDLQNQESVVYFANQGDGADTAPLFLAVDVLSGGNDVLTYEVPEADTILFVAGGGSNGLVYFYGAQNVYAVNMSNVIREFTVDTALLVDNYDTTAITRPDNEPTGSDTSYRVTLTIRDENGVTRPNQLVKVWASDTVYVTNHGDPITLDLDTAAWLTTDGAGRLTLAVSAFDNGSPTTGSPNIACPAILAWSNFMALGEAIVIYPDHESLTNLSQVSSGPSAGAANEPVEAAANAPLSLDAALGYDGLPLFTTTDSDALDSIAKTLRNTIGSVNPAQLSATALPGRHRGTYVRRGGLDNVLSTIDDSASTDRAYAPGADSTFTVTFDVQQGTAVYQPGVYDDTAPDGKAISLGSNPFTHLEDLAKNVIHGAETIAKMAWQFAENTVTTTIHTAENVYDLALTSIEDAAAVVTGLLKSVVNDVKRAIQWLSKLFNWSNIVANHKALKLLISNPSDPDNPGIADQLKTWIGAGNDGGSVFCAVQGSNGAGASSALTSSGHTAAGQTVNSAQSGGNNDPNTVYNRGGQNNASQCTWMSQKVNENQGAASVGLTAAASGMDPSAILAAAEQFVGRLAAALEDSFADLPAQITQKMQGAIDSFKDPKSLVSTGVSAFITLLVDIVDDMVAFAKSFAADTIALLATMLDQFILWLDTPLDIPFVSDLYKLISGGDPLTVFDLACLVVAVPATILLDVITGSPTVPTTADVEQVVGMSKTESYLVLLGIGGFVLGELGSVIDTFLLGVPVGKSIPGADLVAQIDLTVDFGAWACNAAAAWWLGQSTGSPWQEHDYVYQLVQLLPQAINLAGSVPGTPISFSGNSENQVTRDYLFGGITVIMAAVYAVTWPGGYLDAPNAKGLTLVANALAGAQGTSEIMIAFDPELYPAAAVTKVALTTIANVLTLTGVILGAVTS